MGIIGVFAIIVLAMLGPSLIGTMVAELTRTQVAVLLAVGILIGGYVAVRNSDAFQTAYWRWSMPEMPAAETNFIKSAQTIHRLRVRGTAGANVAAALRQAEATLCAMPTSVAGWTGRIDAKYLAASNRGEVLAVTIWPDVVVRTALFPDATGTLIGADTPVFKQLQDLAIGVPIRFDGHIVGHQGACPGDPPVDRNEQLREPESLFFFSRLEKAGR